MRKIFKTVVAAIASTAMVATLFAGYTAPINAAEANALEGVAWTHDYQSWEANDAVILNSTATDTETGFIADISITGWQRQWEGVNQPDDAVAVGGGWSDNPFQLRSTAVAAVAPGTTYKLSFTVTNEMKSEAGAPTEKNIRVIVSSGIAGDTDNVMLTATATVPANSTETFEYDIPVAAEYTVGAVVIELAYGAFCYSYEVEAAGRTEELINSPYLYAPGTTEGANSTGKLTFSDISMMGEYVELTTTEKQTAPPMETTTKNDLSAGGQQQTTTVAPTTQAPTTKANVTKPAKVKIKKAKNLKGKKVKITWKKVKGATKYQVKVGTKKKTTKKLKLTIKVAKKKTYKVRVRAYKKGAGYGKWSNVKKVKVTK